MSFNIGSQHANMINNVQGDQTIHGGQHATITTPTEARRAIRELREEIAALGGDDSATDEAVRELDEMEHALEEEEDPDKAELGRRLGRVTEILSSAGAIVSAGAGIGSAIVRIATWLGPFGAAALRMLGV
jgi:hypothetical protein